MGGADGGLGGDVDLPVSDDAAQGALELFADNEGDTVHAGQQLLGGSGDLHGVVSGDGLPPGQELTFQTAGDEDGGADLKEDVTGALVDRHGLVGLPADLFHFAQGSAGDHELKGAVLLGDRFPAKSQTEAVHGNQGQTVLVHHEEGAGVDGTALVLADGEDGLADHGTEGLLGDLQGVLVFHVGQLREVLGVDAHEVELTHAAGDVDLQVFLLENDGVVCHLADDLTEKAGGQDHGAGFLDICLNGGTDAGLLVVAGNENVAGVLGLQQEALQGRNGALGGDCPGGSHNGALKKRFLTGKFHGITSKLRKNGNPGSLPAIEGEQGYLS